MALRIYNTLTRNKEEFVPLTPGRVGIYVCGVTVYDFSHVGPRAQRDGLRRDPPLPALPRVPGHVRAELHRRRRQDHPARPAGGRRRAARSPSATSRPIARRHGRARRPGPPTSSPKATEHIPQMIALIERLVAKGVAYPADGDVYFEVRAVPRLRQAVGQEPRRAAAGRPRRGGRAQARPARLRALEGAPSRASRVAQPVGSGPARLAHRVLGDGDAATWARPSTSTAAART